MNRFSVSFTERVAIQLALKPHPDICLIGFISGVCFPLLLPTLPGQISLTFLALLVALLAWRLPSLLAVLFFTLGLVWATVAFSLHHNKQFPDDLERKSIRLTGQTIGLPTLNGEDYKFRFCLTHAPDHPELRHLIGETMQLSCYRCPLTFESGQHWSLTVRLKRPHGYASWGAFDYEKYLFRHRIVARGYVRTKEHNSFIRQTVTPLNRWRGSIGRKLSSHKNQSVGLSIIRALAIGDKSGLNHAQKQVLQNTGVSHLMAISGMHIGLVFICAGLLGRMLLWPFCQVYQQWPRQHLMLIPGLLAAVVYSALAGFAVSTQRALVMLTVYSVCRLCARDLPLFRVLILAMFILLLFDPFSILDVGFWLSCGAVFIIAEVSRSAQPVTLLRLQPALWLGMLPLTSLFFGRVSLVSPLVNLIAVPVFCMLLIPATLLSIVLLECGFNSIAWWSIDYLSQVFNWIYSGLVSISTLPFASRATPAINGWQWGLIVMVFVLQRRLRRARLPFLLAASVAIVLTPPPMPVKNSLRIVLLDVGQGLSMVIETPQAVTVYDTGPRYSSGFAAADAVLIPYLRSRGIKKIDRLIISHADNDHIGGLARVIETMPVSTLLTSRPDRVPDAARCEQGQTWFESDTRFAILSPNAETPSGSNNQSCVLLIEHRGTRVLLTGDIEKPVERALLNTVQPNGLRADILLVPHQGSKTSSTTDFIKQVSPRLALVAAGYRNHYGHPHPEVVMRYRERGIPVLSTIEAGSIVLELDAHGWRVSTFRDTEQRFWHYQKVSNARG